MILHLPCTNIAENMTRVVIKILQGSAVTQIVQGGLVMRPLIANFILYSCLIVLYSGSKLASAETRKLV